MSQSFRVKWQGETKYESVLVGTARAMELIWVPFSKKHNLNLLAQWDDFFPIELEDVDPIITELRIFRKHYEEEYPEDSIHLSRLDAIIKLCERMKIATGWNAWVG